jgi:two-component sensor histidine kinase
MQTAFRQFWPDGTERWLLLRAQLAPTLSQPKRLIGVLIDVTDSTQREVRLEAVARELQHRLLNAIAVISAIASSTFRDNADASVALVDFKARLLAMGKTTKLMFSGEDHRAVRLSELVSLIVAPYAGATHGAFEIRGDEVMVPGLVASSLAMALHELCTNAVKYGALSAETGLVRLKWQQDREGCLIVTWKEQNGPPVVPPKHKGFGSMLLNQVLFRYPDKVDLEFQPDGLSCRIRTRIIGAASDSGQ